MTLNPNQKTFGQVCQSNVEGLAADVPGPTVVDPEILFAEDENFNQGHFAEAVR